MGWAAPCRKCTFVPRTSYTSSIFKVLVTLKTLHGSRQGARGSTLEDIAMHMIKNFCLDGDVRSQVLASLKYGVKMNYINKCKEKFSLITQAASIPLAAGAKEKKDEIDRITCMFPPWYESNPCRSEGCGGLRTSSCCGKGKNDPAVHPCVGKQPEENDPYCCLKKNTCPKRSKPQGRIQKSIGHRRGVGRKSDICKVCPPPFPAADTKFKGDAHKNCTCCNKK